mgnify:CR=1 FL=1
MLDFKQKKGLRNGPANVVPERRVTTDNLMMHLTALREGWYEGELSIVTQGLSPVARLLPERIATIVSLTTYALK